LPGPGFRRALFGLGGRGLAPWLAGRGFDVYVLEWRGTGRSTGATSREGCRADLQATLAELGREGPIAVVGHGLGGWLALGASGKKIRALAALGSPFAPPTGPGVLARVLAEAGPIDWAHPPAGVDAHLLLFRGNDFGASSAAAISGARWSADWRADLAAIVPRLAE